jgi:hypothetical protein
MVSNIECGISLTRSAMRAVVSDTIEGAPKAIEDNLKAKLLDITTRISHELDGIDLSCKDMTANVKLLDIINRALNELDKVDFPSKEDAQANLGIAMRFVKRCIEEIKFQEALGMRRPR